MKITVFGASTMQIYMRTRRNGGNTFHANNGNTTQHLEDCIGEPGGNGLLAASVFSRHGLSTSLLTKLSADSFGKSLEAHLNNEAVTLAGNFKTTKCHTDTELQIKQNYQQTNRLIYEGCFTSIDKNDIKAIPSDTELLYIASVGENAQTTLDVVKYTTKNTIPFAFHLTHTEVFSTRQISKLFACVDILLLSRDEACIILGGFYTIEEIITLLLQKGLKHFVVFDGSHSITSTLEGLTRKVEVRGSFSDKEGGVEAVAAAAYVAEYCTSHDASSALAIAKAQIQSVKSIQGAIDAILTKPKPKSLKVTLLKHTLRRDK